jgi:hypothetical protein
MKIVIAVICLTLLAAPVLAATEHEEKAKSCQADASKKGLKGDKRKAFINDCVSASAETKPKAAATPEAKAAAPAPAQAEATSGAKPAAAKPAAAAPTSQSASTADKKRLRCEDFARQSSVAPSRKKTFMDQCMSG